MCIGYGKSVNETSIAINLKSSQVKIFLLKKYTFISNTLERQQGLFVPSVSEFNTIYNNLFVDQQTQQSNEGVSIGVHFKTSAFYGFTRHCSVPKIETAEMD